jgi:hypothetical protein
MSSLAKQCSAHDLRESVECHCGQYQYMKLDDMHTTQADMRSAVDSGNVLDAYRVLVEQALSNVATPELHLAAARYGLVWSGWCLVLQVPGHWSSLSCQNPTPCWTAGIGLPLVLRAFLYAKMPGWANGTRVRKSNGYLFSTTYSVQKSHALCFSCHLAPSRVPSFSSHL